MAEQESQSNKYVESSKKFCVEVMELAKEAMLFGNPERAEQIVRDGFYALEFAEYERSLKIYKGIKKWAEENKFEETLKKNLSGLLKIAEERQRRLNNFDEIISPLILRMNLEWGGK